MQFFFQVEDVVRQLSKRSELLHIVSVLEIVGETPVLTDLASDSGVSNLSIWMHCLSKILRRGWITTSCR